jgi:hypothetical protein
MLLLKRILNVDSTEKPKARQLVESNTSDNSASTKLPGGAHPTRSAAARWGDKRGLFAAGFVVVPHSFLHRYASLTPALTTGEALFVLHLMSFKWDRELPYPTYKTLAQRMGITDKMVRRYAQALDKKGYLRRHYQTKAANRFDLTGLFEALSKPPAQDHGSRSEEINFA